MANNSPITLVTATPGGGKTALVVKMMMDAVEQKRPIFQMGIPELNLPYIPTPPLKEWTELREDPENPGHKLPYFCFPENALIVLDEAQRVYRPRPAASKLPDHVAAFETVRHTGVTFIMITQDPSFLDSHIRKLIGQHIHLIDFGTLGRRYYEWPYAADPSTYKTAPIKKRYTLPKEAFPLYKSSSLHIKRSYTIPPALITLIVCVLLLAAGGWYLYGSINKKMSPQQSTPSKKQTSGKITQAQTELDDSAGVTFHPENSPPKIDPAELLTQFEPRISGRPETAPAYDELRKVKQMPYVDGCIQSKKVCVCYTQQGTNAGLDRGQCKSWMANRPFNAYAELLQTEVTKAQTDARNERQAEHTAPSAVGILGGMKPSTPAKPEKETPSQTL